MFHFADVLFLVIWLLGSLLVGLLTMCTLRLSDSWEHNAARGSATAAATANPTEGPTTSSTTAAAHVQIPPVRQRSRGFFRRWRGQTSTSQATLLPSDVTPFATSAVYDDRLMPLPPPLSPPMQPQRENDGGGLTSSATAGWVPQPFCERPLSPDMGGLAGAQRRALADR